MFLLKNWKPFRFGWRLVRAVFLLIQLYRTRPSGSARVRSYHRAHTTIYWSSLVAGLSQRQRVHKIYWASITGSWTFVSSGKCAVISMGAWPLHHCCSMSYTWTEWSMYLRPPQYWRDGQNVHNLLFWKEFIDQFGAAFGDPWLWQCATWSAATYYVSLIHIMIITYDCTLERPSLLS